MINIDKISPDVLTSVNTLECKDNYVIVYASDFNKVKKYLNQHRLEYIPYRFASSFYIRVDKEDLGELSNLASVEYIHANTLVLTHNRESDIMNISKLTENKYLGQGQTICYIDTGLYPHFDFIFPKNRIIKFIDLMDGKHIPYDDNGHGTFVAGIGSGHGVIRCDNIGIAPRSNVIMLKALSSKGSSNSNVILDAMQWIYENHKVYNISVVCMSFGADILTDIDPLSKGAESLWKRGIIVVAAAGNSGPKKSTIKSPGNNKYIITVGAMNTDLTVADFSSRGPTLTGHKPDLIAPAVSISNCNNSCPPYTEMSGTSVATPIIAGICAVIKSRYPNMNNNEIKQFLLNHCIPITNNPDIEGAGYINFANFQEKQ